MKDRPCDVSWKRFVIQSCRLVVPPLVVLLLITFATQCSASGQLADRRQLTLIHSADPQFESILNANYPGLERLDGYQSIRPFLVFLRNDTASWARAYTVEWVTQTTNGRTQVEFMTYMQKHFEPEAETKAFVPGELRLITPGLNVSPSEYTLSQKSVTIRFSFIASNRHPSAANAVSVAANIDAVIYADGAYSGPDRHLLLSKYQAVRDGERDEGASISKLLQSNVPVGDVVAALERDAEMDVNASASRDPAVLYAHEYALTHRETAQSLLSLHRRAGLDALRQRTTAIVNYPKETISALLPN